MFDPIQTQLRASAQQNMQAVSTPPFTCFFNPDSGDPGSNYAIPDQSAAASWDAGINGLGTAFRSRQRTPRLEYIEEYAPDLASVLEEHGYTLEMRSYLMQCTVQSLAPLPSLPGLEIHLLDEETPLSAIQELMTVQRRSFGEDGAEAASMQEAGQLRSRLAGVQFFAGWLYGEMVSVGSLMQPHAGVAEVAGIATLRSHRRRGVATALTAAITQAGFDQGLEMIFLTAGSPEAGRVYQRVGYRPLGHGLAYIWTGETL